MAASAITSAAPRPAVADRQAAARIQLFRGVEVREKRREQQQRGCQRGQVEGDQVVGCDQAGGDRQQRTGGRGAWC
jgi:hypothetical protein